AVSVPSEVTSALLAYAVLLAVVVDPHADPGRTAVVADDHHVRDVDRHVPIDDPALHGLPAGLLVPFGRIDTLDDQLALTGEDPGDTRLFSFVLAGDDHDLVALADARLPIHHLRFAAHHNTSGASETIRMKRRSRSSRATGPKMRVPRGCSFWSMITQAFSSKRI